MSIKSQLLALGATLALVANAPAATIIGGSTGNGDFNAGGGGTAGGAQPYDATVNWFNGGGAETINFTNHSQMGGSTDPDNGTTTRGGMPFRDRLQVNDTAYTIGAAGEVFSLSYDFGAGGPPARWNGAETMETFLFTSAVVDGNTVPGDITILAGSQDDYAIDRANDGQWTTRSVPSLYTSTAADIGKTVYFGMTFRDGNTSDGDLFPRIDVVNLEVTPGVPEPTTLALLSILGLGLTLRRRE